MEFDAVDDAVEESKFCSDATSPAATVDALKTADNAVPFGYTGFCVSQWSSENEMLGAGTLRV
jgi:hypothetical protein